MKHGGFEPPTTWLKVKCSTDWATRPFLIIPFYTWKMPRAGIEPATRGFSVLCSTNWAIWALSSGDRIWTYDLRVMSPTSFQTAPPRDIKKMDGGGFEPPKQFAADLQSVPFGHSGIHPYGIIFHRADRGTRTPNLLITNQLLCQLSHIGMKIL